jgi:hypothetical protein
MTSSKPSTPILQRRYGESEISRIPISLSSSPVPFRRTNSMRLRPNCSLFNQLNETTLKQHNKNFQHSRNSAASSDRVQQLRLINLQRARRGSVSMDEPKSDGSGDPGGTSKSLAEQCNGNVVNTKHMNGDIARKNDRGMVSLMQKYQKNSLGQQPVISFWGNLRLYNQKMR